MDRAQVVAGILAEYDEFIELIAGLTDEEWRTSTRCEKWEVRDVAGHVLGNVIDVTTGVIGTRSADEQAAALRVGTPASLADDLRKGVGQARLLLEAFGDDDWAGPSPIPDRTLGAGVLTLWFDTFMHADDIRVALGRPTVRGAGLEATIRFVCDALESGGWGPARLDLEGFGQCEIGEGGPTVSGDAMRFALAATGRCDPAELGLDESVNVFSVR